MKNLIKLIVSIGLSHSAGIIGSVFTAPNIDTWYATLAKPSFSPPNWIFAPVWLSLYTLIGIALYFVWKRYSETKFIFWVFIIHLIFNGLWSYLFFGVQNPFLGLMDILILDALVIYLVIVLAKFEKKSALLLLPYLAWILFATVLNFSIWRLNL